MNLNVDKYQEKSFKIFTPREQKNERNFEQILYPEKTPLPLSCEILNKTRIVSDLAKNIEKIFYDNEVFLPKEKIYSNNNSNSKEKDKNNILKKKSIRPSLLSKEFQKGNPFYLNKILNKGISRSRNYNFPLPNDIKKENDNNLNLKKDPKFTFKKINYSLINKKENKNINNRNFALSLSNLTELNLPKTNFQNKKTMKKAISSNILNKINSYDSFNKFKKNNNNKLNLINFNSKKRAESNKNILLNRLKPYESNITFTNYILSYTDRNSKRNSRKTNSRKLTNDFNLNLNKELSNLSSSKTNIYNNYNKVFSEEDEPQKQNDININRNIHNFSNSLTKVNKIKLLNKIKIGNPKNLKQNADNFKNLFNNKIKSLNTMVHIDNKKLIKLINTNNKIINTTKEINMKKNDKLDNELDIRKDLLDKNEKIYTENGIKENLIENNNNYRIRPTKDELIKSFNLLKKNINKISSAYALDIIEKCVDKKQREKLDVKQLLKDYNNHKTKKEVFKIVEIRKKAEKNYKKMIKMKFNF